MKKIVGIYDGRENFFIEGGGYMDAAQILVEYQSVFAAILGSAFTLFVTRLSKK